MIEAQVVLFLINLWATCDISKRLNSLELDVRYGTIPSEMFPSDPRHRPAKWYELCGRMETGE